MTPLVASVGDMSAAPTLPASAPTTLDPESREWLRSLREDGGQREDAIRRLHALLLKAARFEVARRRAASAHLRAGEVDEIANEAADDALVSVLGRLDTFRGASRFTTWAYKFALLEAAVKVRRRAWQGREVPLGHESWDGFATESLGPDEAVEQWELLDAVREEIERQLTPHQRRVLIALAVDGVPIDVLAERLGTTRGALYKTLHDARRKLRVSLADRGLAIDTSEEVTR
jgi:RNA polymerase sigma-70 factor (ECF subfamily)